jgi:two-component system NarL family sensor kinase
MRHKVFFIFFICLQISAFAQKQSISAAYFEEQLRQVNTLKNTNLDSANKNVAVLIKMAQKEKSSLYEAKFLLVQGTIQYLKDHHKEADQLFNRSLVLFQKSGDQAGVARVYNNLGILAREANDTEKALMYQNKGLQIRLSTNDPLLASSYNNIASIYQHQGDYPKSLDFYLKGLPIAESNKDQFLQSSILNNIGLIYWKQSRYNEAFEYLEKCLKIEKERNDILGIAGSYNNMAGIRMDQDRYDEALNYCKEAIVHAEKANSNKELARSFTVLGELEYRKKNYDKAVAYGLRGLDKRRKLGNHTDICKSLIMLGETYIEMKDFKAAENVLLEGLDLSKRSLLLKEQESIYRLLGNLYNRTGKWEKVNEYYQLRDSVKDLIFNESNSKIIFELQTKYETEKKENKIIILDRENNIKTLKLLNNNLALGKNKFLIDKQQQELTINELEIQNKNQMVKNQKLDAERKAQDIKTLKKQSQIQELEIVNKKLEIRRRNLLIFFILMVFLAIGIVSLMFYNRYRLKQKNLLQAEIFKQQEIAGRSLFEGEQQERIRIARDLHDSLGQMLSVVKMNISTMSDMEAEHSLTKRTAALVDKTIEEVRLISHNLIPEELNFGLFGAIESLCDKITASGKTKASLSIPEDLQHYKFKKQNELGIYRIVQEALNNMTKHAGATEIGITVTRRTHLMIIQIKDNGKGFDTNDIKRSNGLGWKNIAARVSMLNGELQVSSEILTGTAIEISIPEWNKQATA